MKIEWSTLRAQQMFQRPNWISDLTRPPEIELPNEEVDELPNEPYIHL